MQSEYVIRFTFPLPQWLHEIPSVLRYTYIAVLLVFPFCGKGTYQ
jgi:hypothetical protein